MTGPGHYRLLIKIDFKICDWFTALCDWPQVSSPAEVADNAICCERSDSSLAVSNIRINPGRRPAVLNTAVGISATV